MNKTLKYIVTVAAVLTGMFCMAAKNYEAANELVISGPDTCPSIYTCVTIYYLNVATAQQVYGTCVASDPSNACEADTVTGIIEVKKIWDRRDCSLDGEAWECNGEVEFPPETEINEQYIYYTATEPIY